MVYKHTQSGILNIAALTLIFFAVFALFPLLITEFLSPVSISAAVMMAAAAILFYALRVEIREDMIICTFGIGLIRKQIMLSEIEMIRKVRNPWYAGWGIRWAPGEYWMWNIAGLNAVELVMKNGKKFRIGTDEPEKLYEAIQSRLR